MPLVVLTGGLALAATSASAAVPPPEAPVTLSPAQAVTATTATLEGTLNPGAKAKAGWFFAYSTEIMCAINPLTTPTEPEEEVQAKTEKAAVTGLEPRKEYKFCLFATNEAGEATQSANEVSFTTPAAEPAVLGESVSSVKATEATLEAVLNPNNQTTTTTYSFEYSTKGKVGVGEKLEAPIVDLAGGEFPAEAFGETPVGASTGAVLNQGTTYFYRVVAKYGASETKGKVQSFTTAIPPETPLAEKVKPGSITATTVEVQGELNHLKAGEKGSVEVLYKVSPLSAAPTGECEENTISVPATGAMGEQVSAKLEGLQPNAKYTFCLRARNQATPEGETAVGAPVTFNTLGAPPEITSESASNVKSSEVTFEGTVNANNQLTECHFQYVDEAEFVLTGFEKATEVACTPELLKGFGPQSVGPKNTEGTPTPTGVSEGTVYHYQIVTKNGKGEEATLENHFQTFEAPTIEAATEVSKTAWELHGALDPNNERKEEPGTYVFVYRQYSSECQYVLSAAQEHQLEAEHKTAELEADRAKVAENKYTTPTAASGAKGQAVEAEAPGLEHGAPYTVCLLIRNAAGNQAAISGQETFTTVPAPPTIVGESASNVNETDATLEAEINPEGAATTVRFEYLTQAQYEADGKTFGEGTVTTPESESIDTNDEAQHLTLNSLHHVTPVPIPQAGKPALTPATPYRYRVVATNSQSPTGGTQGEGKTFTTSATPGSEPPQKCTNEQLRAEQPYGLELPDCRAYEMVSPTQTGGNDATDSFIKAGHVRASEPEEEEAEGEEETPAITYDSRGSFAEPEGATFESQLLSRRNGKAGRWETRSITAPHEHDADAAALIGYSGVFFTPELTKGLTETAADLTSAPEAAPEGLHELYLATFPKELHEPISYKLVSHLPPSEEEYAEPYTLEPGVYPLGASSNLSHVIFATENNVIGPLREWVAPSSEEEYAEPGRVVFVGVSNEAEVWTGASVGNSAPSNLIGGAASVWRAVSEDGSRVVFNYSGGLYARVNAGANVEPEPEREQSALNTQKECTEPTKACTVKLSAGAAKYWGANTDDTKIFYIENGDLYEYELPTGSVQGQARALTSSGEVQGVVQISEDGSYVYYVADAKLAAGAIEGQPNLYVTHDAGAPKFIATLSPNDRSDWQAGPGGDTAVLAPGTAGGARLAFISQESLTGYDNQQAAPGDCENENALINEGGTCREVFLYDPETGGPVCVSCDPSGARPVGPSSLAIGRYGSIGGASNYRPRDLLADGELFFDSSDALVAHSSGGVGSVYEYEDGHVYPISDPAGRYESFFLDATPGGTNVFFATADQLVPQDKSTNVVVYVARKGGGLPLSTVTSPCTTAESCKPPGGSEPGVYGPAPSATFSGPGNLASSPAAAPKHKTVAQERAQKLAKALKACRRKHNKHKRQVCEKVARKRYGAKASKAAAKKPATRVTNDPRAGR